MTSRPQLKLLLPGYALPFEDEGPLPPANDDTTQLFRLVEKLVTKPALRFGFKTVGQAQFEASAAEKEVTLESVVLRSTNGANSPTVIDDSTEFAWWNASGIQERLRERSDGKGFVSATKMIEALADELTQPERFEVTTELASKSDATLVPIFRWNREQSDKVAGQLLGFWLRPAGEILSGDKRLETCTMIGITTDDEIAGRGLRELVASVLVLGLSATAATMAQAGTAGDAGPRHTTASSHRTTSQRTLRNSRQRSVQSNRQEPAKIYQEILDKATPENIHVLVSLSKQRVYLMVGDEIAIDSPISSGRAGKSTPTGEFTVSEKDKNHVSTLYHCPMKYFLRLSGESFGMHVGQLPGYPASHGCIRLPENVAKILFETADVGTSVTVAA